MWNLESVNAIQDTSNYGEDVQIDSFSFYVIPNQFIVTYETKVSPPSA
ncbi:hypothetical protein BH18THE2_BH18THE2_09170 [soil metagenome]